MNKSQAMLVIKIIISSFITLSLAAKAFQVIKAILNFLWRFCQKSNMLRLFFKRVYEK